MEMVVVAAIIGLLASATGMVYFGTYKKMLVEKGAKALLLSAKFARITAVEEQKECKLLLDEKANRFCLTVSDKGADIDAKSNVVISNEYAKPCELEGKVVFEKVMITPAFQAETDLNREKGVIVFNADGTADTAVIQIGDGKTHYTVYILAATGRAKLVEGIASQSPVGIIDLDAEE